MVYSNKFVMCVLLNGKPQEELANGMVKLPFGAEYALRFRNKNNRRAVVKLYIDGENVSGGGYVINANDFIDIKRHHDVDRAFKFVSLDSADAIEHGKNGPNTDKQKGVIEARFYLEKETPKATEVHHHHHHDHHHYPRPRPIVPWPYNPPYYTYGAGPAVQNDAGGFESIKMSCSTGGVSPAGATADSDVASFKRKSLNRSRQSLTAGLESLGEPAAKSADATLKDGCTVEGYSTGQNFHSVYIDYEDSYTTLKIFLQGYGDGEQPQVLNEAEKPVEESRKTNKDMRLDDLEAENERLRRELAELENEKLRKQLENAKKD